MPVPLFSDRWASLAIAACLAAGTARGDQPTVNPTLPRTAIEPAPVSPYEPSATEPEVQEAWRKLAPAEAELLMKVQRQLGGPLVDQVMPLDPPPATPRPTTRRDASAAERPPAPAPLARHDLQHVRVLRDAARRTDESAARMEDLGLYAQADQARELATRLRLDARGLAGADPQLRPAPAVGRTFPSGTGMGQGWPGQAAPVLIPALQEVPRLTPDAAATLVE
ncbi:MAG: hypothetical protein KF688_04060 [Pirellulales bacterium]|nr:hypothetical protein [Pirellulales bacterium]